MFSFISDFLIFFPASSASKLPVVSLPVKLIPLMSLSATSFPASCVTYVNVGVDVPRNVVKCKLIESSALRSLAWLS